jgi:hypothetical protein
LGAAKAIRANYPDELDYILVQPALKGSAYRERWDSPLLCLWQNLMGTTTKWSVKRPTAWANWNQTACWEHPPEFWLAKLIELGVPDMIYPTAPPIYPNEEMIENWWEQRARRRIQIREAQLRGLDEDTLISVFPQNFSQCEPLIGRACNYLNCCWIPHVGANPLAHGFEKKSPHSSFDPLKVAEELGCTEGT